ncbi:hypothetical protein ACS0TY_012630 [Phlomoides rotata]
MYKSVATVEENMSNLTSAVSGEASVSSCSRNDNNGGGMYLQPVKRKRNQPGQPDPGAEVIALSPRSLLATNRFVCEVCNKGFQRDQNLQLHRRGHNLPWKLKQRSSKEVRKKVYICPEVGCVHHDASRALGDLTGIKKHFYRKHGEKKWKCDKCSKKYAVQSDWKAHSKICGTREYRCDCGTVFSRRDSFITHRAFCDALARENVRTITVPRNETPIQNGPNNSSSSSSQQILSQFNPSQNLPFQIKKEHLNFTPPWLSFTPNLGPSPPLDLTTPTPPLLFQDFNQDQNPNPSNTVGPTPTPFHHPSPYFSATALLQKAAQMGSKPTQFLSPHQGHVTASSFGSSSRDEFIHSLSSYGNKAAGAAAATGGSTETGAPLGGSSSNALVHEMMMMNNGVFETSTFDEDMAPYGNAKRDDEDRSFSATVGQFSKEGENMTRDFLGLRPLSQSEILSISGFDDCINGSFL